MLRSLVMTTVLVAGAATVAYADVYRWVDDHGGVHYSDQWVPGSELIKSTKPRPSVDSGTASRGSDQQKLTASNDRVAAQAGQQNAAQAVKQDLATVRVQQCKDAKDRYDKAIQARRIFKTSANDKSAPTDRPDDRQYLSDDEADAYRVQARKDMQEVCAPATK